MSFAAGTQLGVFEVSTLLGVGGMGEVYRARDTKLGREVAIKVLPDEFAHDRDRLARFQREARLLAALNHPNVAHIYDLEEADGVRFLVMELVEGETLADRISNGPLPLEDVLKVFGQIAEGLEAAHQQGVIHRDLKPANIKITDDGKVSVLDFGLAKAAEIQRTATNDGVTSPWDDDSAGKSTVGQIVGTPAYMSPEQARGKVVDKRSDIWAFGCCLYEAITGQRSFRGETVSDTLAMILATEPDWKALPESTPPRLRELLESCLAKDVRDRLHDIADARLELGRIASNPGTASTAARLPIGVIGIRRSWLVAAALLGLTVSALVTGATVWSVMRSGTSNQKPFSSAQGIVRLTMDLPQETAINISPVAAPFVPPRFALALSPDGSRLVYAGGKEGETKLYLRPMDRLETSPLPGTEGAEFPFISPDGQSVGFFAGCKLKKIRVGESRPTVLCDARNPMGASWARDGMIYFAESSTISIPINRGLKRIRDSGGEAEWLTHNEVEANVSGHGFPCALPDDNIVLFTLARFTISKSSIAALSLKTGKWKEVLPQATISQYIPTGHLLFRDQGWYYAARFDTNRLQVAGPRIPLVQSPVFPVLSNTGCFVHGPSDSREQQLTDRPLVWVNRLGETERLKALPRPYSSLRVSPDGKRLLTGVRGELGHDIWIFDLERETNSRLTFAGLNLRPIWTPDGERVIFSSDRGGKAQNLFSVPADGSAQPRRLAQSDLSQAPHSVSPDGRILAFLQSVPSMGWDIYTLSLDGDGAAQPLIQTEFTVSYPAFSPDGRWLAYHSDETGRREVFVQPYPPTAAKWQISDQGGGKPVWSSKGDELFYRDGPRLYAVPIRTEPAFTNGQPKLLFEKPFVDSPIFSDYDVSPDAQRFVFVELTEAEAALGPVDQLTVVQNWFEELQRLAPPIAAKQPAR